MFQRFLSETAEAAALLRFPPPHAGGGRTEVATGEKLEEANVDQTFKSESQL